MKKRKKLKIVGFIFLFFLIAFLAILLAEFYSDKVLLDKETKMLIEERKQLKKLLEEKEKELEFYEKKLEEIEKELKQMKFKPKIYRRNINILAEEFKRKGF